MKTLWQHCNVATMADGTYSIIEDAAIVTYEGFIEWIGPRMHVPEAEYAQTHGLEGAWVTPGLIDCHTHAVFGGNRSDEFEQRLQGTSYADIAAAGGGIASTVRATRAASEDELFDSARQRLNGLLRDGVTCVEIKSGYGLCLESERKMLRVIRRLGAQLPITVRSTCLAAHALPPEYRGRADDYIEHICTEMLPALAAEGLKGWWMRWMRSASTWRFPLRRSSACSKRPGNWACRSNCMRSSCRRCMDPVWRRGIAHCRPIIWSL